MNLYLVRHGETDWNVQGIVQGWSDIPLNLTGIAQAKALHNLLKREALNFDIIYSSPLKRTRKTAEILVGPNRQVITDARLLERGSGEFEGKPRDLFFNNAINFLDPETNSGAYGVEPILDFSWRIADFLTEISHNYSDDMNILIVTSQGVMKRAHILITDQLNFSDFKNARIYEYNLCKNANFTPKIPQK